MAHLVLLGDSIFDNARYVPGEPDVAAQVRAALPNGWSASLLAGDGSVAGQVPAQVRRLPAGATHLVVSVGGNDALMAADLLHARIGTVAEGLVALAAARDSFADSYRKMLEAVLETGLPTAVCTIYDTPSWARDQRAIKAALALFNDAVTRAAFSRGVPVIDLRLICDADEDYANPIEPSAKGGAKIAAAIARFVARKAASSVII
jgi:lysophospholipase L1-like esterase